MVKMLKKKMLRDLWKNKGQFITIFLFSMLAMLVFVVIKGESLGGYQALKKYNKETNRANGWVYGEGFSEENLEAVRKLEDIKDAQLRTKVVGEARGQDGAQVDAYFENENIISKPMVVKGADIDFSDHNSIWIDQQFADAWKLKIGDNFTFRYQGLDFTRKIAGFVESSEYLYYFADTDMDVNFKNMAYVFLSDDLSEDEKLNSITLPKNELIFTSNCNVFDLEQEISNAIDKNYAVLVDQKKIPGIQRFYEELEQHSMFAYVYPLVFVILSILLIMTTMRRIVEKQRTQIGTMNALGVSQSRIVLHYISYSFISTFIGTLIGALLGLFGLGKALISFFTLYYILPNWKSGYDMSVIIVAVLLVLLSMLSAWLSCKRIMRVHPAEALRPAAPKSAKKCIFEYLPFWNKLNFNIQYNFRDISRYKLRTFMSIVGVIAGMMMMVMALECNTMLVDTKEWNFNKLCNYDYQGMFEGSTTEERKEELAKKYNGELIMTSEIEIAKEKNAFANDKKTETIVITEGRGLYRITNEKIKLSKIPKGTIALTKNTAEELGVKVGDTVYWHVYDKNTWYETKVGIINRNPTVTGVTIERNYFENLGLDFSAQQLLTNDKNITNDKAFYNVNTLKEMKVAFDSSMSAIGMVVYMLIAFSVAFVIMVLYNAGSISFEERRREFGTLKVLGMSTKKIRGLMTIQNIGVTIIGVIIGAPFGPVLLQWMMDSNGGEFDYQIFIKPIDFILSALFVFIVSIFVSFLFSKRIKNLDMVECMKANE